jgi:hypothetical protein
VYRPEAVALPQALGLSNILERTRRLLTRTPFPLEPPGALGYSPVAFRVLSASLPDLTIRKKLLPSPRTGWVSHACTVFQV